MEPYEDLSADEPAADIGRKDRCCLMCGVHFSSEGAGERVCRKCKTSSSWRNGVGYSSGSRANGGARRHSAGG